MAAKSQEHKQEEEGKLNLESSREGHGVLFPHANAGDGVIHLGAVKGAEGCQSEPVSQDKSPALTDMMKGLFLSGLACSLPFQTQSEAAEPLPRG